MNPLPLAVVALIDVSLGTRRFRRAEVDSESIGDQRSPETGGSRLQVMIAQREHGDFGEV